MIDIHTHVVPYDFPTYRGVCADHSWPSMAKADTACHRKVIVSSRTYRVVEDSCWNASRRLEDMGVMGVQRQVLSPMPELLSYWMAPEDTQTMTRFLNDFIAETIARDSARFSGLGVVTMQDPARAIADLRYIRVSLGLAGVEIGSNINGRPIGDPLFEPFFSEVERLDAAVFVHPLRPAGMDRLVGPAMLEQVVAFPSETALAATSILTSGLLARYPNLRIAFSHGGGGFALTLPRLRHAWRTFEPLRAEMPTDPLEVARKLFYDCLVYDAPTLRFLVDTFGLDQILLGTDYPFSIADREPARTLTDAGLSDEETDRISRRNAERFLAL